MSTLKYSIVQFDEEGTKIVEIAPSIWLEEELKLCYWPPLGKLKSLSKKGTTLPLPSWRSHSYEKILGRYESWETATEKVKLAEDTSNLESSQEDQFQTQRRRKKTQGVTNHSKPADNIHLGDSSDGDDEADLSIPPPTINQTNASTSRNSVPSNPEISFSSTEVSAAGITDHQAPTSPTDTVNEGLNLITGCDEGIVLATAEHMQELKNLLSGFQRKCFEILERQSIEIREIKAALHNIRFGTNGSADPDYSAIPEHPLKTKEHLGELENWIISATSNEELLTDYLALSGGTNAEKNVRKILKKLFAPELSRQINFTGKGGKVALKGLAILDILKKTVRKSYSTATDSLIETSAKDFFRFTKVKDEAQ